MKNYMVAISQESIYWVVVTAENKDKARELVEDNFDKLGTPDISGDFVVKGIRRANMDEEPNFP